MPAGSLIKQGQFGAKLQHLLTEVRVLCLAFAHNFVTPCADALHLDHFLRLALHIRLRELLLGRPGVLLAVAFLAEFLRLLRRSVLGKLMFELLLPRFCLVIPPGESVDAAP